MIELIELKETGTTRHAEHVDSCRRCQALLRSLDVPTTREETEAQMPNGVRSAPSRRQAKTVEVTPGMIWTADSNEFGFRELVAVVARSRRDRRLVVVVPISNEIEDATDLDLRANSDVLGYPALLAV